jgi:hypothetical protein
MDELSGALCEGCLRIGWEHIAPGPRPAAPEEG